MTDIYLGGQAFRIEGIPSIPYEAAKQRLEHLRARLREIEEGRKTGSDLTTREGRAWARLGGQAQVAPMLALGQFEDVFKKVYREQIRAEKAAEAARRRKEARNSK